MDDTWGRCRWRHRLHIKINMGGGRRFLRRSVWVVLLLLLMDGFQCFRLENENKIHNRMTATCIGIQESRAMLQVDNSNSNQRIGKPASFQE